MIVSCRITGAKDQAMQMMEEVSVDIDEIYIPVKRRGTLVDTKVAELAESILADGQQVPIQVRRDEKKDRYVLVEGLHRLEACRALGESAVAAFIVDARKY